MDKNAKMENGLGRLPEVKDGDSIKTAVGQAGMPDVDTSNAEPEDEKSPTPGESHDEEESNKNSDNAPELHKKESERENIVHPEDDANPDSQNEGPDRLEPGEVERLIAEAEERGYFRGRNEQIEAIMGAPGHYGRGDSRQIQKGVSEESAILANMRRSVWD